MSQRLREVISEPPTFEYFEQRLKAGWIPVAVEWMMPVGESDAEKRRKGSLEIPYGFQVGEDGQSLIPDKEEMGVLYAILEQIVADKRFSHIADELNRRHMHQRTGGAWTSSAVFDLLPRLIESGPLLVKSEEWARRRQEILASR